MYQADRHYLPLEPRWSRSDRIRRSRLPRGLAGWLLDRGSLTARLRGCCGDGFRVRVVRESWGRPWYSERGLLGMRAGQVAFIREVELRCDDRPLVFARTLLPVTSLVGGARRLARLGSRPLGEVLFSDPATRRELTEIAQITPRHPLFRRALAGIEAPPAIWGRRTLFRFAGQPLLVNELFLPEVPEYMR